jgi:hypothetical protein
MAMSEPDPAAGDAPEHERSLLDRFRVSGFGLEDPNIVGDAGPDDVAPGMDPPLAALTEELPPEVETPSERLLPSSELPLDDSTS